MNNRKKNAEIEITRLTIKINRLRSLEMHSVADFHSAKLSQIRERINSGYYDSQESEELYHYEELERRECDRQYSYMNEDV